MMMVAVVPVLISIPYQSGKASNHKAKQLNSQHSFRALQHRGSASPPNIFKVTVMSKDQDNFKIINLRVEPNDRIYRIFRIFYRLRRTTVRAFGRKTFYPDNPVNPVYFKKKIRTESIHYSS